MITHSLESMRSTIEENTQYVKLIQDENAQLKYRLDHISLEEGKQRQAVQTTILQHVTSAQNEIRDQMIEVAKVISTLVEQSVID